MTLPLFIVPILAGLVAQVLKPLLNKDWRDEQARTLNQRPRYGGMPSAHTAFATSLAVVAWIADGPASVTLAIAVAVLILVLDDALRLRIFLGRYGTALRRLLTLLPAKDAQELPHIEWRMGHTLPEVAVGALVGLLVTLAVFVLEGPLVVGG